MIHSNIGAIVLGFKDVTSPTNDREHDCRVSAGGGFGNTIPILFTNDASPKDTDHLLGMLNSFAFDFCARAKIEGQHLFWFLSNNYPFLIQALSSPFRQLSAHDIVKDHVLRLTYTAHDMAPFARDMGYVKTMER